MKVRTIVYVTIFVITLLSCNSKSLQDTVQCNDIANQKVLNAAFLSFENDLFNHYNLGNDTIKTYRKFLSEISNMSINLKAVISEESIKITHNFIDNAKTDNSLWISYYGFNKNYVEKEKEEEIPITSTLNNIETEEEKKIRIAQEKEMLILNYKGPFIQCLKDNSDNVDLIRIIEKLEWIGPVNQSIIANGFNTSDPKTTFESKETKAFIAFGIYYYILMITIQ